MKALKIATFNIQGCKTNPQKIKTVVKDIEKYGIQIMAVVETHIEEMDLVEVKGEKKSYYVYQNGIASENKYTGVGIVIDKELPAVIDRITDRICTAEVDLGMLKKLVLIIAYAPTQVVSEKYPKVREQFYSDLSEITRKLNRNRHFVVTLGDFNAKTGSGYCKYSENMGRFGKGELNSNGAFLLEYAKEFDMFLTNTNFKHKMCHRTTWTAPVKIEKHKHHDGTERKNPYRNQIDYIIVKNQHKRLVEDSRSYSGTDTNSDHKMVLTKLKLDWWKIKTRSKTSCKVDIDKFNEEQKVIQYKNELTINIGKNIQNGNISVDNKWDNIVKLCKETGKSVLGNRKPKNVNKFENQEIQDLSKTQKQLKLKIESTQDATKRREMKKERNQTLNKLKREVKAAEDKHYEKELEEIEKSNDYMKSYKAVKYLKNKKPRKQLKVFDKDEKYCTSIPKQVKIITSVFNDTFEKPNQDEIKLYPPCKNEPPFDKEEIATAAKKLKNGKSPGIDDLPAEMIKNAPEVIYE